MQYPRRHYEIFRFEQLDLLYRVYLFENGEIAFTATGDPVAMPQVQAVSHSAGQTRLVNSG